MAEADSTNLRSESEIQACRPLDTPIVPAHVAPYRQWTHHWWIHLLLFCATVISTTAFGSVVTDSFRAGRPLDVDTFYMGYDHLLHSEAAFWSGLWFSVPLLTILLAHEFGHYFACRYWGVEGSLPFFLPSPTLLGTFGAFIKIRSPIYTRRILFDIGASGPFSGFIVLLPVLVIGMALSRPMSVLAMAHGFAFSTPLLLRFAEYIRFGHLPGRLILLHPVALAAWAGLLATAVNLLPLGQLDGGHILYSVFGERGHKGLATVFVGLLVVFGFFYAPWWAWAVLMFFFGRRHPLVYDASPLTGGRKVLAFVALIVFLLSMSIVPVESR